MKNYLLSILAAAAVLCTACGGGDEPAKVNATGVKLDKTMVVLEVGESTTVKATLAPENATNKKVKWAVKNAAIATVNNGVVKGVAVGETELTATTVDGGHTATIPVKVVSEKVAVTGISITYTRVINEGQEGSITVCFSPNNATNTNATITLSDPDVLSIEYKGSNQNPMLPSSWPCYTIKGLKAGNCIIKAVSEDGGFEYECTVTVMKGEKPTNITVDGKNSVKLLTWHGKKLEIVPDMTPVNADLSTLTWTMNDWKTQNPCTCKIEAKKITVESNLSHYPYQFESVLNGTTIYGNGINDRFDFTAYFRTHAIFSNHFEETKQRIDLSLPNTPIQISADLEELPYTVNAGTLYFEAYCPPIEYYASASPMWTQFPEAYIPTSEYTLTSSDETKWKVTKVSESPYKIEDLAPSSYKEIDLTYTCGEFSFTRKFKVVPK
ncbi:MAG: Ig-like domain-containing protein [Alistipes sp.]|nr:Ig-like domain-containing protein [Alistipes sp.]